MQDKRTSIRLQASTSTYLGLLCEKYGNKEKVINKADRRKNSKDAVIRKLIKNNPEALKILCIEIKKKYPDYGEQVLMFRNLFNTSDYNELLKQVID